MSGNGTYYWSTGDTFVGEFDRDRRDGNGLLTLLTGEIYETTWKNGKMIMKQDNSD
jgi:hypothetical protein